MLEARDLTKRYGGADAIHCASHRNSVTRRHRELRMLAAWAAVLCLASARAKAQSLASDKLESLPAFLDATVPKLMDEQHVAGTAVAVVHQDRIVFLRGYGEARLDAGVAVDPSRTVFRIGSVTKVFTAVAAMQLVESGKLDLRRDVREYLPDIPLRYTTTTHQLLTHTAGLDERFAGAYTDLPQHLEPLSDHLRRFMPEQVRRPGTAYSYANYHYAVVGLLVERLSGLSYEEYVAERIFKPLKMPATTARQPPPDRTDDLARGYRWNNGRHEAIPYSYTYAGPSGGMTTTVADLGRFMLAVLGGGSLDGARILSPESMKTMLAPQYTSDARIPAAAYGFSHWLSRSRHLLIRGGTLGDQATSVVLIPDNAFGIVVASNALPGVGDFLFEPLMTRLFGPEAPAPAPAPLPDAPQRAARLAGVYRDYHHTRHDMSRVRALMPMLQSAVVAEPDGAIRWQGRRWVEVEPFVFRSVDTPQYIVFRDDGDRHITELHMSGGTYERIGWREQRSFHLGIFGACVIAFVAYPVSRGIRSWRRGRTSQDGRTARGAALFVALVNLGFVVGLAFSLRDLGAITPLPLSQIVLLSLPLAVLLATTILIVSAVRAWRRNWWTLGERLGYSALTAFTVTFAIFLNYWKLLGIRY